MSLYLHPDILDNGLSTLSDAASLTMSVCQGAPTTRAEASGLLSGAGNRVSNEITVAGADVALGNGATAQQRRVTIDPQTGTVAESVSASPDLWVAVYDGTRLLMVTDEVTDQTLTAGNPITIPETRVTFVQPVIEP